MTTANVKPNPYPGHDGMSGRQNSSGRLMDLALPLLSGLGAVAIAIGVGLVAGRQGLGPAGVLGVGAVAGLALSIVAFARFEFFLLILLTLRPLVDLAATGKSEDGLSTSSMPATVLGGLAIVVCLGYLVGQAWSGSLRRPALASLALGGLAVAAVISLSTAVEPMIAAAEAARLIGAVIIFIALDQVLRTPVQVWRVLGATALSAVGPLLVGIGQMAGGATGNRLVGSFAHPNAYAFYLTVIVLTGLALVKHVRGWMIAAALALTGLAMIQLLFTYSRSGWIAAGVGLIALVLLEYRKLFVPFLVVMAMLPVLVPSIGERLAELEAPRTYRGTAGNTLVWRMDYWRETMSLAQDTPLTGIGVKMTEFRSEERMPPHNDYLRSYVEMGLIGAAAWGASLIAFIGIGVRGLRTRAGGPNRGLAVAALSIGVAFAVGAIGSNLMTLVVVMWAALAVLACALAAARQAEHGLLLHSAPESPYTAARPDMS